MENKLKHAIKTIFLDIVVGLLGVSYIFYRTLYFEVKELDPLLMLLDGLLGIAVGIIIKQALGENGFIKGYDTDEYKIESEKHNNACNDCIDYIDYYDNYEDETIEERKMRYRKSQLHTARLKYEYFFYDNGEPKDVVITKLSKKTKKDYLRAENEYVLDRYQRRVLKRCYRVKIKVLNLFSEYNKDTNNFSDKDTTDKAQRTRMFSKNLLSAIAFTLAGVYFVPKLAQIDIGAIIFACVQVCGFITTGIIQMFQNIQFVKVDKVNTLKEKTKRLSIFINNCRKGKYREVEYRNEKLVEEQHIEIIG